METAVSDSAPLTIDTHLDCSRISARSSSGKFKFETMTVWVGDFCIYKYGEIYILIHLMIIALAHLAAGV
jgi:hypothetical protein